MREANDKSLKTETDVCDPNKTDPYRDRWEKKKR